MTNIQIMNQADKVMAKWINEGENGFFVDFWKKETGFEVDSKEYELVNQMIMDGLL